MLLASKQHSGAQTKFRFKILAKPQCTVTANKGVPPEREELKPQLPQCWLLATNIQALMVEECADEEEEEIDHEEWNDCNFHMRKIYTKYPVLPKYN